MSQIFQRIRKEVEQLQDAYESQDAEHVQDRHAALVQRGHRLSAQSAAQFWGRAPSRDKKLYAPNESAPTAPWTETGLEGVLAYLRAVELANRFDSDGTLGCDTQHRRYLLLIAAVESYRCGRHGVAAAIQRRRDAVLPQEPSDSPMLQVARVLSTLCREASTEKTWNVAEQILNQVRDRLRAGSGASIGWLAVANTCQALLTLREHLKTGRPRVLAGLRRLRRGLRLAHTFGDGEMCRLLEAFYRAYQTLCRLSLWSLKTLWIGQELPSLVAEWIRYRVNQGRAFLFPSQYQELIERNALQVAHALISLPTGAGKSLIAELFTLRALIERPGGKVLVIVPSRALAAERSEELRSGLCWDGSRLRVCHMTGETTLNAEQTFHEHDVIVVTPEKFDTLMRSNFFACKLAGLVVDEFHVIRSSYRGIKLQLSLSRFVRHSRYASVPTLYISAMLRPDDFTALRNWAFSESPMPYEWKPTPARIGTVALDEQPWTIEYNDGTWHEIIPTSKVRRNATIQASEQIVTELLRDDQVLHFSHYWRGYFATQNVLIKTALEYVERLNLDVHNNKSKFHYVNRNKNNEIAYRIERLVGDKHPISIIFRKGIAVHWGELPHSLRRLMEQAIRDKAVALVLATSTLADGVNLPIKTVYVPKLGTSKRKMPMWQFLNLVGRAGRPFFHEEGQVVVASCEVGQPKHQTKRTTVQRYVEASSEQIEVIMTAAVETARQLAQARVDGRWPRERLFVSGEDAVEATSPSVRGFRLQIKDVVSRDIEEEGETWWSLPELLAEIENFSACLLAILVDGVADRLSGSPELEQALFLGTESSTARSEVLEVVKLAEARLLALAALKKEDDGKLSVSEWGQAVYRTGFGPETCHRLREALIPIARHSDEQHRWDWSKVNHDFTPEAALFKSLFSLLSLPFESVKANPLPMDAKERQKKLLQDQALLRGWLGGQPLSLICARIRQQIDWLSDFDAYIRLDGTLATFAEWVFYAAWQLTSVLAPQRTRLLGGLDSLARSIRNGHYDSTVLLLLRKDTGRELLREDVLRLYRGLGRGLSARLAQGITKQEVLSLLQAQQSGPTLLPETEFAAIIERISANWNPPSVER